MDPLGGTKAPARWRAVPHNERFVITFVDAAVVLRVRRTGKSNMYYTKYEGPIAGKYEILEFTIYGKYGIEIEPIQTNCAESVYCCLDGRHIIDYTARPLVIQ